VFNQKSPPMKSITLNTHHNPTLYIMPVMESSP
jgi:hypothetical protein